MSHNHARGGGKRSYRNRRINLVDPAKTFLIVCEGEKTEPNYLRAFRVAGDVCQVDIYGTGFNTLSLVQKTIEIAQTKPYDQVWCVFDRDSFSIETFNAALDLARQQGFQVVYSNEAFELWYLLHFHYYNTAISRHQYCMLLDEQLKRKYCKNDRGIYALLYSRQPEAIRNAKRLLMEYNPSNPARDNPSTTVFRLVEALNQYLPEERLEALSR